jgi:hypothetical protein
MAHAYVTPTSQSNDELVEAHDALCPCIRPQPR